MDFTGVIPSNLSYTNHLEPLYKKKNGKVNSSGFLEFKEENGVFIINSNKSLTCFLKLVLGRLYTNPITQHQMEANYARKLN